MATATKSRKNSNSASALGMVGGAAAGAAAGSLVGPLGAAVGAVVGGAAGANAKAIARRMPRTMGSIKKLTSAGKKAASNTKRGRAKSSAKRSLGKKGGRTLSKGKKK